MLSENVLTVNISFDNLLVELEKRITATIIETIKSQSEQFNQTASSEELLSRKQACELLGISLPTLSKYLTSGKLPYSRLGKKILFEKRSLLNACKVIKKK